jgi:hypothetical protein
MGLHSHFSREENFRLPPWNELPNPESRQLIISLIRSFLSAFSDAEKKDIGRSILELFECLAFNKNDHNYIMEVYMWLYLSGMLEPTTHISFLHGFRFQTVKRLVVVIPRSAVKKLHLDTLENGPIFTIRLSIRSVFENHFTNVHCMFGRKVEKGSTPPDCWRLPCEHFDIEETEDSFLGGVNSAGSSDLVISTLVPIFDRIDFDNIEVTVLAKLQPAADKEAGPQSSRWTVPVLNTTWKNSIVISFMSEWPTRGFNQPMKSDQLLKSMSMSPFMFAPIDFLPNDPILSPSDVQYNSSTLTLTFTKSDVPLAHGSSVTTMLRINEMICRLEFPPSSIASRSLLSNGCSITLHQVSPCTVKVCMIPTPNNQTANNSSKHKQSMIQHLVTLPYPLYVTESNHRIRVARKSSYLELVLTPSRQPGVTSLQLHSFDGANLGYKAHPFPILVRRQPKSAVLGTESISNLSITSWNSSLYPISLPLEMLQHEIPKEAAEFWLRKHLMGMFSELELGERRSLLQENVNQVSPWTMWKEQFMSIVLHSLVDGIDGELKRDFMLSWDRGMGMRSARGSDETQGTGDGDGESDTVAGGGEILVHVNGVRFDHIMERVVLDTDVCVLTQPVLNDIGADLIQAGAIVGVIRCPLGVLELWKRMLPAAVERARVGKWGHKETCEYLQQTSDTEGSLNVIALAATEYATLPTCACGLGHVSSKFEMEAAWMRFSRHFMRAAFSPVFAASDLRFETVDEEAGDDADSPHGPPGLRFRDTRKTAKGSKGDHSRLMQQKRKKKLADDTARRLASAPTTPSSPSSFKPTSSSGVKLQTGIKRADCPSSGASARGSGSSSSEDEDETKLACAECRTKLDKKKKCGGCKQVVYCSRECQVKAWPSHKRDCIRMQKQAQE